MTQVKVCGITRVEDGLVAAEAGADFLGFVFYERSRRRVEPSTAHRIIDAVRERSSVEAVGVFVNATPHEMNHIARVAGLQYVQLSGDEGDDTVEALDVPAIQVVHVRPDSDPAALAERIEGTPAEFVLLDTASSSYGGTGETFDWRRLPPLTRRAFLAGGLHAGNVGDAIRQVGPWAVDVSSGVERDGQKDPDRVRAFLDAAKRPSR